MKYQNCVEATFLERPNRFLAKVILKGKEEIVHVKNTGRCKELLVPNAKIILEKSENPNRKTNYSLIAVYKEKELINMDSQAPNQVAAKALIQEKLEEIGKVSFYKREAVFQKSRFDFYYEQGTTKGFLEVKGVTLEKDGTGLFPDAPTKRGARHILELIQAKEKGYEAAILFLIQMKKCIFFRPNWKNDSVLAEALQEAKKAGVKILVYDCQVTKNSLEIGKKVSWSLEKET